MPTMNVQSTLILAVLLAACGDVAHPPKRGSTVRDAGEDDVSLGDAESDGPKRPLPLLEECTRCGTTPCLQVGAACVGDPVCQSCFADVLAPGCIENDHLMDLGRCACTSVCYDVCREVCEATRHGWERRDAAAGKP
jgi:hypothetical protein